jgi:hypothetical protein
MTERVLVCVLAKTRAHELTYPSFGKHVLDELGADLALALTVNGDYDRNNSYWQRARYRWTAPDPTDYGPVFDSAQRELCRQLKTTPQDWRKLLRHQGTWAGRIDSATPHPSASSILVFSRWLLLQNLVRDDVLDRYDRFVITRSDYVWLCPHPPLSILDRQKIWVPDDHHWSGINDRHAIVSREHVVSFLNGLEDILLKPDELMSDMGQRESWNDEQLLALHLQRENVLRSVREFPYVMYAAHAVSDLSPTWARGRYEPSVGHYVKYESEFRAARAMATVVRSRADWEQGHWKQLDMNATHEPAWTLRQRITHRLDRSRVSVLDQLSRPGLPGRAISWCQRRLEKRSAATGAFGVVSRQYDELSRKRAF